MLAPTAMAWIEHTTGGVALALTLSALVHRDDGTLRWRSGVAALLWAAHNAAIGAMTAAAINGLTVLRQGSATVLADRPGRARTVACAMFVGLAVVCAAFTWQGVASLAVLAASVLTTWAMYFLHGARLRAAMFVVSLLWLANALLHHSIEQTASIVATATASAVGTWRVRGASSLRP